MPLFDIGVKGDVATEFMSQVIFSDHFVAVFSKAKFGREALSLEDFCSAPHVIVSRRGTTANIVDRELRKLGRERQVIGAMSGYREALETAAKLKCIVCVPQRFFANSGRWYKLAASPLPVITPSLEISQTWHPRHQADPEHLWLRGQVRNHLGK